MLLGNDISEFQGTVDWDTYKKNANFAIIRATYGVGYVDKQFARNQSEARRVGLPRGYYTYCYPQYNLPDSEADWFLKTVDPKPHEMLCLDYEEAYTGDKVKWCKEFLDHVSGALGGYKPLIYLNQSLATNNDWSPVVNAGYGLWIAAYTYDPKNNNFQSGKWNVVAMQQWTNRQTVPGIPTKVDGDVFFGDIAAFDKYCYQGDNKPVDEGIATATPPQAPNSPTQPPTITNTADSTTPASSPSSDSTPVGSVGSNPTIQPPVINTPVIIPDPIGGNIPPTGQKVSFLSKVLTFIRNLLIKLFR